jgi:hypothetical protein
MLRLHSYISIYASDHRAYSSGDNSDHSYRSYTHIYTATYKHTAQHRVNVVGLCYPDKWRHCRLAHWF